MKKLLLLFILNILPLAACAESAIINGINYVLYPESKTASVAYWRVTGSILSVYSGDMVIPEEIEYNGDTYTVTGIYDDAFNRAYDLTSISLPKTILSIGRCAFAECKSLTSITIPESVTTIADFAFSDCTGLTSVTIPSSVTNLGKQTFRRCTNLTSVTLHCPTVSLYAFRDSPFIKELILGDEVKTIDVWAFIGCTGLTSLTIPSGVKYIRDCAFANCSSLTDVFCLAVDVPNASSDAFDGSFVNSPVLHVPAPSIESYRTTNPWSQFQIIVPYEAPFVADCEFSDVPNTNDFYAPTCYLYKRGVLSGSDVSGKMEVENPLKRAHLANITFRGLFTLNGREIPSTFVSDQYPGIYDDLKSDAPYYQAAKALLYLDYGDGITPFDRDRDGFLPDGKEARINVLKELMEAFNIKPDMEGTDNPFPKELDMTSLSESSPIKMGYVRQAAKLGIITTENEEFRPYADCLRGEAFLMLARIIQKIEAGEITDPNPQESDFLDPNSGKGTVDPNAETYAALSEGNTVLTFYYDGQREARGGIKVGSVNSTPSWKNESVTTIVIDPSFANCTTITRTAYWFDGFANLTSITGLQYLKTDNVTSMRNMFSGCSSLTSLDLSGFKTDNVTDMGAMFYGCRNLTSLDLSGFNTGNVTDMYGMFHDCNSLTNLDLSRFNTENVTDMDYMFLGCSSLTSLDLSGFKTDNVTNMQYMFYCCSSLTNLDLSSFKTDKVANMQYMFNDCYRLTTIYVGDGWSTAAVTASNSSMMFAYCYELSGGAGTKYDANHIDYTYARIDGGTANPGYFTDKNAPAEAKVESYAVLSDDNTVLTFYYDDQKSERNGMDIWVDGSGYQAWYQSRETITKVVFDSSFANYSTLTTTAWWFYKLNNLTTIENIGNLKTDNVTSMLCMFAGCKSLTSIDLSSLNTGKLTDMGQMFLNCSNLTSIDLSTFNTAGVTDMSNLFSGCSSLQSVNLSGLNTDNLTNMYAMFNGCSSLTSLDLSNFKTSDLTFISFLFSGCSNLTTIYVSDDWTVTGTGSERDVFSGCTALVGGAGTVYDSNYTDNRYAHIDGGASNPGYFTAKGGGGESSTEETEETEEVIKITSAGQTTWCSASDLDFTGVDGLKAYIAPGYNRTTGTIWLMRVFEVPANEGILLIGDPGEYKVPKKSTTTYYENMFVGTLKAITINETEGEYTNYYLSNGTSGVGFYKVDGTQKIGANRAYLPLLKGMVLAGTRFIGFEFGDGTTSVKEVKSGEVKGEKWYTLQGQRVAKPAKGLYIKNGKKVIVR